MRKPIDMGKTVQIEDEGASSAPTSSGLLGQGDQPHAEWVFVPMGASRRAQPGCAAA